MYHQRGGANPEKVWREYRTNKRLSKLLDTRLEQDETIPRKGLSLDNEKDIKDVFVKADPTINKAYMAWIIKSYIDEGISMLEDVKSRIPAAINDFQLLKNKNLLSEGDPKKRFTNENNINNICGLKGCTIKGKLVVGLDAIIDKYQDNISKFRKEVKLSKQAAEEGELIYQDRFITVVHPTTEAAACHYGRGTKWCTAALVSDNMFNYYNKDGPLYIITPKKPKHNGEKYQLQPASKSLMDERDDKTDFGNLINRYPTIKNAMYIMMEKMHTEKELSTALVWFVHAGDIKIVRHLLSKGVDVIEAGKPLTNAAKIGHIEIVKLLIHEAEKTPPMSAGWGEYTLDSYIGSRGYEALRIAVKNEHLEIVQLFLDNVDTDIDDWLMYAVNGKYFNFVKILLDRGVNPYLLPKRLHDNYKQYFKIFQMRWQMICKNLNKEYKLSELRSLAKQVGIEETSQLNKRDLCKELAIHVV